MEFVPEPLFPTHSDYAFMVAKSQPQGMREIIGHISFDISHLSLVTYNDAIRVWIDRQAKGSFDYVETT